MINWMLRARQGLSPLARGNPQEASGNQIVQGPIPARAGEPPMSTKQDNFLGAYPRSRGGTYLVDVDLALNQGLSPLARGNLRTSP